MTIPYGFLVETYPTMSILDAEYNLWGWGENQFGKLGNGTATTYDYEAVYEWTEYFIVENNDKAEPIKIMNLN